MFILVAALPRYDEMLGFSGFPLPTIARCFPLSAFCFLPSFRLQFVLYG
jgi:hypothetical protein